MTPTHLLEVVGGMDQHDTDTDMSRQNPSPIRGGYISRPERRVLGNPRRLPSCGVTLGDRTPSIFLSGPYPRRGDPERRGPRLFADWLEATMPPGCLTVQLG